VQLLDLHVPPAQHELLAALHKVWQVAVTVEVGEAVRVREAADTGDASHTPGHLRALALLRPLRRLPLALARLIAAEIRRPVEIKAGRPAGGLALRVALLLRNEQSRTAERRRPQHSRHDAWQE